MGVLREILTDQGSNFMSKLLGELYRLLHVHPIKTSPYHRIGGAIQWHAKSDAEEKGRSRREGLG